MPTHAPSLILLSHKSLVVTVLLDLRGYRQTESRLSSSLGPLIAQSSVKPLHQDVFCSIGMDLQDHPAGDSRSGVKFKHFIVYLTSELSS